MINNKPVVKIGSTSGNTVGSVGSFVIVVGDETTVIGKQRRRRFDDDGGVDVRDSYEGVVGESRSCSKGRFNVIHEAIYEDTMKNKTI